MLERRGTRDWGRLGDGWGNRSGSTAACLHTRNDFGGDDVVQDEGLEEGVRKLGLFLKQNLGLFWMACDKRLYSIRKRRLREWKHTRPTFIWASISRPWPVGIVASVWLIASRAVIPGGAGLPGGRFDIEEIDASDSSPRKLLVEFLISPLTVDLPSRKGSESARSIRRGRPPTSVLFRFLTADNAVSWSCTQSQMDVGGEGNEAVPANSQNP